MAELPLQNTYQKALVDEDILERLRIYKWYLNKVTGYVYGYFGNQKQKKVYLHRFILGLPDRTPAVDHADGNPLNCTRDNLRVCTIRQNAGNQRKRENVSVTSKFKGVSWEKRVSKWRATIFKNYKQIHIGTFESEEDAAKAYNAKAIEVFGEFARLNNV